MTQHEDQSGLAKLAAIMEKALANDNWITVGESATGPAGSYKAVMDPDGAQDTAWLVFTGPTAEGIAFDGVGPTTAGFDYDGVKYDVWPETPANALAILTAQAEEATRQAEAAAMKAVAAITSALPVRGEGDKCACGNDTSDQGFGFALADGTEVEDPTPESGWDGVYKCHVCGALSTLAEN